MIRVTFPNDTTIEGKDAAHVLDGIAAMQWPQTDRAGAKLALARRAENWTGQTVDEALADTEFLDRLVAIGAVKLADPNAPLPQ